MAMQLSGSLNLTGSLNVSSSVNLSGSIIINKLTYPTFGFADGQYGVEVPTLGVNNVFSMQIPRTVYEYVKNDSGVTLLKGTPVHSTGTVGFNTLVIAASASNASTMPATFILAQDLDDEEEGLGIAIGAIQGVNTTGLIAGDAVYVGANGGWTQTKPTGSNLIQNLGIVTKVGNNGGGVILGAGRSNDVPNIQEGYFWAGNSGSVATAFATSSFALTSSANVFFGKQSITGGLNVNGGITGSFKGDLVGTANFSTYTSNIALLRDNTDTTLYPVFSAGIAADAYYSLKGHTSGTLYYNGLTQQLIVSGGGLVVTGSSNTTGSINLIGTQTITGSLLMTGSITITSGSITMPHRPAFRVVGDGGATSTPTILSGSRVVMDYNQGNHFNPTNGEFTAPIAGLYQVNIVGRTNSNSLAGISQIIVEKRKASDSSTSTQIMVEWAANTTANHIGGSTISKLEVGDKLYALIGAGTISFDGNDNFSVAYIG